MEEATFTCKHLLGGRQSTKAYILQDVMAKLNYKVLLACSPEHSEDVALMENFLYPMIRDVFKWPCSIQTEILHHHQSKEHITSLLTDCEWVVILLTENSLHGNWIHYDILMAMEKCRRVKHIGVVLVLFDICTEDIRHQMFGVLKNADIITYDSNLEQDILRDELYEKLTGRAEVPLLRPQDNVWKGLAWIYYLKHIQQQPNVSHRRVPLQSRHKVHELMSPLHFIIVPSSSKPYSDLAQLDDRITPLTDDRTHTEGDGQHNCRNYRIVDHSLHQFVLTCFDFTACVPDVLNILLRLENKGNITEVEYKSDASWIFYNPHLTSLSDAPLTSLLDPKLTTLSAGGRLLQTARFCLMLNRLTNHYTNEANNRSNIVFYHVTDSFVSLSEVLLKRIKSHHLLECSESRNLGVVEYSPWAYQSQSDLYMQSCKQRVRSRSATERILSSPQMNVLLVTSPLNHYHLQTLEQVRIHLQDNMFTVHQITLEHSTIPDIQTIMSKCKWVIFFLSKETLSEEMSLVLRFQFREILHRSVYENEVRVIALLDGLEESEISEELYVATCIDRKQKNYLQQLVSVLTWMDIHADSAMNIVDVHQGLAWYYVENCLRKRLPDHIEKLQHIQRSYPAYTVCQKLFIIVPQSCSVLSQWELDKDKEGFRFDNSFECWHHNIFTQSVAKAAGKGEDKMACPYWMKWDSVEYIFTIQYPEPLSFLQKMADMGCVSGLTGDTLRAEVWGFTLLVQTILDTDPTLKHMAKLLYYDDTVLQITDVMIEALEDELEEHLQSL